MDIGGSISFNGLSNDGSSWEDLDRRNTQDLDGGYVTKTYGCQSGKGICFRYLRLRQTGKNGVGTERSDGRNIVDFSSGRIFRPTDVLALSEIEFSGALRHCIDSQ